MKIEAQNTYFRPLASASKAQPPTQTASELSPQDKLRHALDEKRWMTESIQTEPPTDEQTLGKLLDLRV